MDRGLLIQSCPYHRKIAWKTLSLMQLERPVNVEEGDWREDQCCGRGKTSATAAVFDVGRMSQGKQQPLEAAMVRQRFLPEPLDKNTALLT